LQTGDVISLGNGASEEFFELRPGPGPHPQRAKSIQRRDS
jgi:hypothetical protein